MSSELRPLSYAVIALVGRGGASAPELVEMAERGSPLFWTGAASHVYSEARRLARLGYLRASKEPAKTRPRTRYSLTPKAVAAFQAWAPTPAPYPRIQHEASIRVFALDLLEEPRELAAAFCALVEEIDRLERLVWELDERRTLLPHRARGIGLQLSLARRLLAAHRDWAAEVLADLAGEPSGDDRPGRP